MCVQAAAAVLMGVLTLLAMRALPTLFGASLGSDAPVAVDVLGLLGATLVVQTAFEAFRGVITGCHRWDLHNALNAGFYGLTAVGMIAALSFGGGLAAMGGVTLGLTLIGEVTRAALAFRVCPELRIGLAYANWAEARRMLAFGAKVSVTSLARLLLVQANSLLVATHLGVQVLAVYARPSALIRHVETFSSKFALVLTPTASSLQGRGRDAELRELLLRSVRVGMYLVLPLMLYLMVLGGPLLRVWMGPHYEEGAVLALLAAGHLLLVGQQPVLTILTGLDLHGRAGLVTLAAALVGVGFSVVGIAWLGWDLTGAAIAVGLPLTVGSGIVVPLYACARLHVPVRDYLRVAFLGPALSCLPFAAVLLVVRALLAARPLAALAAGGALGVLLLGPIYWRQVLPASMRDLLVGRPRSRPAPAAATPVRSQGVPSRRS
jgi:O-antigen/teichoic acid export membrane protein